MLLERQAARDAADANRAVAKAAEEKAIAGDAAEAEALLEGMVWVPETVVVEPLLAEPGGSALRRSGRVAAMTAGKAAKAASPGEARRVAELMVKLTRLKEARDAAYELAKRRYNDTVVAVDAAYKEVSPCSTIMCRQRQLLPLPKSPVVVDRPVQEVGMDEQEELAVAEAMSVDAGGIDDMALLLEEDPEEDLVDMALLLEEDPDEGVDVVTAATAAALMLLGADPEQIAGVAAAAAAMVVDRGTRRQRSSTWGRRQRRLRRRQRRRCSSRRSSST